MNKVEANADADRIGERLGGWLSALVDQGVYDEGVIHRRLGRAGYLSELITRTLTRPPRPNVDADTEADVLAAAVMLKGRDACPDAAASQIVSRSSSTFWRLRYAADPQHRHMFEPTAS